MEKVFIVGAKRSPIGSFMGTLSPLHPADFGAQVLKQMLVESKIKVAEIDEVIIGNILPAGLKHGVARQTSIYAGIPKEVPAYGVNMVCGSGMKAVMNGYTNIIAGLNQLVIAGGVESMSGTPFLVPSTIRTGVRMGDQTMKDHMIYDALTDAFEDYHMGITAENLVDRYQFTREAQDQFAYHSQQKAKEAQESGKFIDEIVPMIIKTRKGEIVLSEDEYINKQTNLEKLSGLRPAFKKDGSVTAGNSSGINDGASFTAIASLDYIMKNNLTPLCEIVGIGQGAVEPSVMGIGPVPAIKAALKHANLSIQDIDLFELNEAFAAQSMAVVEQLSLDLEIDASMIYEKTNVNGGAIALGHPVGASGNRIIVTLIHEMLRRDDVTYGLASLCIGGGMGTAIILKKVK